MKRDRRGLLTGVDYSLEPRSGRVSRRPHVLLGLVAVSAFTLAWMLREDASASAQPDMPAIAAEASQAVAEPASPRAVAVETHAPVSPFAVQRTIAAAPAVTTVAASKPAVAIPVGTQQSLDVDTGPVHADRAEEIEALRAAPPNADSEHTLDGRPSLATDPDVPASERLVLPKGLRLQSSVVLVVDQKTDEVIAGKNADLVRPIASLTKLMTALVVSEARQSLSEKLEITKEDIDREKNTHSRLKPGMKLTREDLLVLALMSSENRAASALGRNYPGGREAFLKAMNSKARALGMTQTRYMDSTGLSDHNVSTARDLVKLIEAAYQVPMIREFSTRTERIVRPGKQPMQFVSSNRLVRAKNDWRIGLQKTGFTNEAGRCLVMQATVKGRPLIMVLLDSDGKLTRFADANRLRQWIENGNKPATRHASKAARRASARNAGTS